MAQFFTKVKLLTEDLLLSQPEEFEEKIETLFSEVGNSDVVIPAPFQEVEDYAVMLWNWAVTKNMGTNVGLSQKAKVRHVACRLLFSSDNNCPSDGTLHKRIFMSSKTGKLWLNCKNPQMADHFLALAVTSVEIFYNRLTSRGSDTADISASKADVEAELLQIISFQAESAMLQGKNEEAAACIQRCRDMLQRIPKDASYISFLCYNFGLETFKLKKFEESAFWLSQSFDIGKMYSEYGPKPVALSKVLRLLATVYMDRGGPMFCEKALNAVTLANKEFVSPAGLILHARILLNCGAPDNQINASLSQILEQDVSFNSCQNIAQLLMRTEREAMAFEFMKRVCQLFESSPDSGSAQVLYIELLLQRGKELLGKQKTEDIITSHYSGKQLPPEALVKLHVILWDQAFIKYEAHNYNEALQWYNYSLSFFKAGQIDSNLAKLQRNRTSCFLELDQLEKAKEAIKEAERCDPDCISTQFLVYKIAMLSSDATKAAEALSAMGRLCKMPMSTDDTVMLANSSPTNFLSLAAQIALESDQEETAKKALEILCENSEDGAHVLIALRCLIRLVLLAVEKCTAEKRSEILVTLLPYLKTAHTKLSQHLNLTPDLKIEEATWFRKIAWNSALQCDNSPEKMKEFFLFSYKFSMMCPPDLTELMGRRTSLLMAAAASLEVFRKSPLSGQREVLTHALEYLHSCLQVWRTIKTSGSFPTDPTESLVLLFEFEARAKLNDPKVETMLESALELENIESKILETMAALAVEPPAHLPHICKKALRIALSLHKKESNADLLNCSKYIHSLIKLSLPSGVSEVEARVLEELWGYYEEALSILKAAPDVIPEEEIVWLLTTAWNTGIQLYSLAQYTETEKWCGLGVSLLRYLASMRASYEMQVSNMYSQILDKLDKAKNENVTEEKMTKSSFQ